MIARRRVVVALAAAGASHLAWAQNPSKIPKLGFLSSSTRLFGQWDRSPFRIKLSELGWTEGKNIVIERVYAEGNEARLPALAADLVRKGVDVIYAFGPIAAIDAARATKTIPIVFFGVAWPVEQGLADGFARPGRNVTGVAWSASTEIYAKQLQFVRDIIPDATRLAHFLIPNAVRKLDGGNFDGLDKTIESAAHSLGFKLDIYNVYKPADFEAAFKSIQASRVHALVTPATPLTVLERQRIVDFTARSRLPSFFDMEFFVEAGGLFHYGPDLLEMTRRAASYVDRILRGATPRDLPIEQPTKFDLVINLKTAKALGIKIPQTVLLQATRLID